jgi:pimeloyl-ACP methyl ester carboxylesterase
MRINKNLISIILSLSLISYLLLPRLIARQTDAQNSVLLSDNFDDGDSNGWEEHTFNGDWFVNNGEYWGTASPSGAIRKNSYTVRGDTSWKNYSYSVKVRSIEEDDVDKIIFFYFNENKAAYEVNLRSRYATSNGNDIVLFKSYNLDSTEGEILDIKSINNNPLTDYVIKVEVRNIGEDVWIKVYVDSNLLIDYVDKKQENKTPIYNGSVGLLIWTQTPHTTAFDNVLVESLDYSPATPIPTPRVEKVILAPGMGASWNTEAILNCKLDGYQGDWIMAPFAEDIYNPLISSLQDNGFQVIPFYYDWRKRIPSHSTNISNLITNLNLGENEKVDFVGHSMGGLVGRAYLESGSDKIYKYISAGSPHQGTALAYPAWYGGEIWNNSLVTKIAATLLIKRCGINHKNDMETLREIAPSFQDLLPTYPFLRDTKTGTLKSIDTNQWLKGSIFPPTGTDTIIATLSGNGFDTLENIRTKEPSKKEKKFGLWEEGKPAGKETTTNGDGTVLSKSAKIEGVTNFEINQNHGGLVTSQEGINTIISFLKGESQALSATSLTTGEEPKSALVMIAYPSTFVSIDPQGKIKRDKHNVAAQINPKSGKYKVGFLPLADESTLLIGQFLKNGDYSWKEYKIKGRLPFAKTIKFDENTLTENPLQ